VSIPEPAPNLATTADFAPVAVLEVLAVFALLVEVLLVVDPVADVTEVTMAWVQYYLLLRQKTQKLKSH